MNNTGDGILVGRFDQQHEAIAPLGNDGFLNGLSLALQNALQGLVNLVADLSLSLPQARQFLAGAIGHFPLFVNAMVDGLL